MIIKMLKIKFIILLLLAVSSNLTAQAGLEIKNACLNKGMLKVSFVNHSNKDVIVPRLSDRYNLDSDGKYLDDKYIEVISDTLMVNLNLAHPLGLIDSKGVKAKGSEVLFDDVVLKPKRCYKSKIRLNVANKSFKYLKINYHGWTASKKLCK